MIFHQYQTLSAQKFYLINYMGSLQFPKSLSSWARYCDCLQNIQRFKLQQPQVSQQEGSVHNEKTFNQIPTQVFKQKPNNTNEATPQNIDTPPPVKKQRLYKARKNKHVQPLAIKKIEKQSQKISQFSELKPENDNIFDIVRLEEDEDIKVRQNNYLHPLKNNNQQVARATSLDLSHNLPTKEVPNKTSYTQAYQRKHNEAYFIDDKDKEEYLNKSKMS